MIYRYVALYTIQRKLRMAIVYRVDKNDVIHNVIDIFAPKNKIVDLEYQVRKLDLLPFEEVGSLYFEEKIKYANANQNQDDIIIHGDLVSEIKNKTQIKNRIIEQSGKELVRKLVNLND